MEFLNSFIIILLPFVPLTCSAARFVYIQALIELLAKMSSFLSRVLVLYEKKQQVPSHHHHIIIYNPTMHNGTTTTSRHKTSTEKNEIEESRGNIKKERNADVVKAQQWQLSILFIISFSVMFSFFPHHFIFLLFDFFYYFHVCHHVGTCIHVIMCGMPLLY